MTNAYSPKSDSIPLPAPLGLGHRRLIVPKKDPVYSQGDAADAVFFIESGKVRLYVLSPAGKEATIGILNAGTFFGESVHAGQSVRSVSAEAMSESTVIRIEKKSMMSALREDPQFSDLFLTHSLERNIRYQEDLVDQLFNSSEKRLARALLLMADLDKQGREEAVVPKLRQELLAEMIGTTRSRVSFFMNQFRRRGFIRYSGGVADGIAIHNSLSDFVLHG